MTAALSGTLGQKIGKVALGIGVGAGTAYGAEKLWAEPLRREAAEPQPDNGLSHIGAAALAFAPAAYLLKAKHIQTPYLREALIGAAIGGGLTVGVTGVIEGVRGIVKTDWKFITPYLFTN